MTIYLGLFIAVVRTFAGFLTTFVMVALHWTTLQGSYITSGHYGCFAFGRFLAIFFVRFFTPRKIIFTANSLMLLSLFGFLMASLFDSATGAWIFALAAGLSLSPIFPVTFMWTEQTFLRVTGKIAAIFLTSASLGFLVNPPLASVLMETFTPMCFCYLLFGETMLLLVLYFVALFISREIEKQGPKGTDAELTVFTVDDSCD
jgi:fucose permease